MSGRLGWDFIWHIFALNHANSSQFFPSSLISDISTATPCSAWLVHLSSALHSIPVHNITRCELRNICSWNLLIDIQKPPDNVILNFMCVCHTSMLQRNSIVRTTSSQNITFKGFSVEMLPTLPSLRRHSLVQLVSRT